MSDWHADTQTNHLRIFARFYEFEDVLRSVSHLADGAITPEPLIENLINSDYSPTEALERLCAALHELVFFEVSSIRTLNGQQRRSIMARTLELVAMLSNKHNVA